uniref:Uncharacterized protein n=1 Tax=viral metagenome TaxID=1070528 RepID=A0A6C0J7J7_9ZZZZ
MFKFVNYFSNTESKTLQEEIKEPLLALNPDIKRLAQKYGNSKKSIYILDKIQDIGIIAGSSVASVTTDNLDFCAHVHDIDVFVQTEDKFNEILDILRDIDTEYFVLCYEKDMAQKNNNNNYSIISVSHADFNIPIQIIMRVEETPRELIENFDMDCIQCAIHKSLTYQTSEFILTKKSGISTRFNSLRFPNGRRLSKALHKGYAVPLYGLYNISQSDTVKISQTDAETLTKVYLNTYGIKNTAKSKCSMSTYGSLSVVGWNTAKQISMGKDLVHYGNFILRGEKGSKYYSVPYLCIPVSVIGYNKYNETYSVHIEENKILKSLGISTNYIKLSDAETPPLMGNYNAVIQLYVWRKKTYVKILQLIPYTAKILTNKIGSNFKNCIFTETCVFTKDLDLKTYNRK